MTFSAHWRWSVSTNKALVWGHRKVQVTYLEELIFLKLSWHETQIRNSFWIKRFTLEVTCLSNSVLIYFWFGLFKMFFFFCYLHTQTIFLHLQTVTVLNTWNNMLSFDHRSLKKGAQLALMNSLEKAIWNWMDNYRKSKKCINSIIAVKTRHFFVFESLQTGSFRCQLLL